jgi:hypothetical protein
MLSATLLTLLVIPVLYSLWREWQIKLRPAGSISHEALEDVPRLMISHVRAVGNGADP